MDLREALKLPARDAAALARSVQQWTAQSARDSENLAMLVDRDDYWLNSEYRSWVTDPEDPDVKAAQAEAKKHKPSESPILPPIAQRDPELAEALTAAYFEKLAKNAPKPAEKPRLADLIGRWQIAD